MLKKLQALKAKKGFTLVELIVVIAIIAVLAAILVPTLLNQVTNSRITSADSTASTLKDAVNAWIVDKNASEGSLFDNGTYKGTKTTLEKDPSAAPGTPTGDLADLLAYLNDAYDFTAKDGYIFVVENHKVKAVAYCANKIPDVSWSSSTGKWNKGGQVDNDIVGTYPKFKT